MDDKHSVSVAEEAFNNALGQSRRGLLGCVAWVGVGVLWTVSGGVPRSQLIGTASAATPANTVPAKSSLSFMPINDSQIGFSSVPGAADAQAMIDNFSFTPAVLTVAVGTKVTWTNRDDIPHTVTDADHPKDIKSPPLDTGESYSRMFMAPGTYHYFCSLHPHMQGTVVVR